MVDNKSKTSLIRHIQKKYITPLDYQYNTRAMHSNNIIFINDILFCIYHSGNFPIIQCLRLVIHVLSGQGKIKMQYNWCIVKQTRTLMTA